MLYDSIFLTFAYHTYSFNCLAQDLSNFNVRQTFEKPCSSLKSKPTYKLMKSTYHLPSKIKLKISSP